MDKPISAECIMTWIGLYGTDWVTFHKLMTDGVVYFTHELSAAVDGGLVEYNILRNAYRLTDKAIQSLVNLVKENQNV